MKKKQNYIRIPGYIFSATIHIPEFSAYAMWYSAYLKNISEKNSIINLEKLPWPQNNNYVKSNIINRLFDDGLLYYDGSSFKVKEDVISHFSSETSIKKYFFKEKKYTGKWWIDAITGIVLPYKIFNKYELDLSEQTSIKKNILEVDTAKVNSFYEMESLIDADISELMQTVFRGESFNEIDKAYIKNNLIIEDEIKEIEIPLSFDGLIPSDLSKIEPLLISEFPLVFNIKKELIPKKINWHLSPIEVFSETLELISDTNSISLEQVKKLNDLLKNKNEWLSWLHNGERLIPVAGNSTTLQFYALKEICLNLDENDSIIILSSFLNEKNIEGFADTICSCNEKTEIIILYGHPSTDDNNAIGKEIRSYQELLSKLFPFHQIKVLATEKRTHEKIIITTKGEWMLGSWNATSSPIDTIRFETSVKGNTIAFTKKLLNRIKDLIKDDVFQSFLDKVKEETKDSKKLYQEIFENLKGETQRFYNAFDDTENQSLFIDNIRKYLYPFISKSKLTIINEHQTRELLVKQVHSAKKEIFLATDSIKESGFDSSLIEEVRRGVFGSKYLFLMWGRNYKLSDEDSAALNAIELAKEKLNDFLITQESPMENHSKFIIIDGNRTFITSENLINYGGEKNKYEGRETGLLIESPNISRVIQAAAFLHKPKVFSHKTQNLFEILFLGNEAYKSLKDLGDKSIDYASNSMIKSAIDIEIKENYNTLKPKFYNKLDRICQIGINTYFLNPYTPKGKWIPFYENTENKSVKEVNINIAQKQIDNPKLKKAIKLIEEQMVLISKGTFTMGFNGVREESPAHKVTISKDFLVSKYLLTQQIWELANGTLPANITRFQRDNNNPIFHVSFNDVQRFLEKINKYSNNGYFDLPTEAEWEYICKAGANAKYTCGNNIDELDKYAWSKRNAKGKIMNVGKKQANRFGVHDIHGLMFEMCKDDRRKYTNNSIVDPIGNTANNIIVTPGGGWGNYPGQRPVFKDYFRCSARNITKKTDSSYRLSFRLIKRI